MLNATELRLGNYVEYNSMVMMIDSIQSPRPMKDKRYSDKYIISLFDGAGLITCTLDEISPITLTEEWFLKFEFEKLTFKSDGSLSDSYFYSKGVALTVYFDGERMSLSFWQGNEKRYVHQLQNLLFVLTNEELKL